MFQNFPKNSGNTDYYKNQQMRWKKLIKVAKTVRNIRKICWIFLKTTFLKNYCKKVENFVKFRENWWNIVIIFWNIVKNVENVGKSLNFHKNWANVIEKSIKYRKNCEKY